MYEGVSKFAWGVSKLKLANLSGSVFKIFFQFKCSLVFFQNRLGSSSTKPRGGVNLHLTTPSLEMHDAEDGSDTIVRHLKQHDIKKSGKKGTYRNIIRSASRKKD